MYGATTPRPLGVRAATSDGPPASAPGHTGVVRQDPDGPATGLAGGRPLSSETSFLSGAGAAQGGEKEALSYHPPITTSALRTPLFSAQETHCSRGPRVDKEECGHFESLSMRFTAVGQTQSTP